MNVVETRRDGGRVVHEHVASLGSVEVPASVADRIAQVFDAIDLDLGA